MFHRDKALPPDKPGKSDDPSRSYPAARTPNADPAASTPATAAPASILGYWQLTRGRLRSFEVPWSDERDGLARLLRTLHGEKDFTLGVPGDGLCVTVYRCHRPSSELTFQFLVTLDSGKQSDKILVEDLPDLLAFLDQLAPIIDLAMKTQARSEMLATRAEPEQPPAQSPG